MFCAAQALLSAQHSPPTRALPLSHAAPSQATLAAMLDRAQPPDVGDGPAASLSHHARGWTSTSSSTPGSAPGQAASTRAFESVCARGRPLRGSAHPRAAGRRARAQAPRQAAVAGGAGRARELDRRADDQRRLRLRAVPHPRHPRGRDRAHPPDGPQAQRSTRSSTPSSPTASCSASGRSSTSTRRRWSSACCRSPARRASGRC